MDFICPLIVVNNIDVSRKFYESVLNQKVKYDFGENIQFEGGFAIHLKSHFADMLTINQEDIANKSNNCELYFEEDNIDNFIERLHNIKDIEFIHNLKEHPWGQRATRFYDPDMHIIEVGESMESVAKRFLRQGLSIEETAKLIQLPIEFVEQCICQ